MQWSTMLSSKKMSIDMERFKTFKFLKGVICTV